MLDSQRTVTISSIVPFASNDYEVELDSIHQSNTTNQNSSPTKLTAIRSRFQKIIKKFDFFHVEKRGIERVLSEDRNDLKIINTAMMWVGSNIIVPGIATGALGPAEFHLSLYASFVTILIFNALGIIPVAVVACFGPASGLRTMVFSRYSWGYYGASIMAIINVITALGWAAINSITGAQTLRPVSDDTLPMAVGIIIISILSMIISLIGYKWIHIYERFSWIPVLIGYCIVAGVGAKYFTRYHQPTSFNGTNISQWNTTSILSFGTACLGTSISWCSFAADYNTYFPEDTSQMKVFLLTYAGNFLTMIPLQLLGAALYTGTYTNKNWSDAYERDNIGGLLGASLSTLGGFGKFLLVLFALSTIACNIPNIYSLSLSAQVIAPIFKQIPRILYTIIGTVVYVILGIIAAGRFNSSLISFMGVISYWLALFVVIIFEEHFIFRRCSYQKYDFDIWNNRKLLPISFAAIGSSFIGIIGIVLGMSQTWYEGPISRAIAGNSTEHGPDLGFECGFTFTAITFPLFRYLEFHFLKR